jgi:hypothetical protein
MQHSLEVHTVGGSYDEFKCWRAPRTTIAVNGEIRILVDCLYSYEYRNGKPVNVTMELPSDVQASHAAMVAWWEGQLSPSPDTFEVEGRRVHAPGFRGGAQFTAYVARAKAAGLRTMPGSRPGVVMVSSGSLPAMYAVTRDRCSCAAGQSHGYCYHRALAIWLHDVEGVPVCKRQILQENPSYNDYMMRLYRRNTSMIGQPPFRPDVSVTDVTDIPPTTVTCDGSTYPMNTAGRKAVA